MAFRHPSLHGKALAEGTVSPAGPVGRGVDQGPPHWMQPPQALPQISLGLSGEGLQPWARAFSLRLLGWQRSSCPAFLLFSPHSKVWAWERRLPLSLPLKMGKIGFLLSGPFLPPLPYSAELGGRAGTHSVGTLGRAFLLLVRSQNSCSHKALPSLSLAEPALGFERNLLAQSPFERSGRAGRRQGGYGPVLPASEHLPGLGQFLSKCLGFRCLQGLHQKLHRNFLQQ